MTREERMDDIQERVWELVDNGCSYQEAFERAEREHERRREGDPGAY